MRRLLQAVARGEEITQDVSTLENPAILDQLRGVESPRAPAAAGRRRPTAARRPRSAKRTAARKPRKRKAPPPIRKAKKSAKKSAAARRSPRRRAPARNASSGGGISGKPCASCARSGDFEGARSAPPLHRLR